MLDVISNNMHMYDRTGALAYIMLGFVPVDGVVWDGWGKMGREDTPIPHSHIELHTSICTPQINPIITYTL